MHTYLVYVGKLNPYRDPIHVNVKALAPRKATVFQAASSGSGHPIAPQVGVGAVPSSADLSAPLQARSESDPASHGHSSIREPSPRELASIHRPPPVLLDEQGNILFHVKRLLQDRCRHGENQYLVKWRWYPESYNSWEFKMPLRQDCPYTVNVLNLPGKGRPATFDTSQKIVVGLVKLT